MEKSIDTDNNIIYLARFIIEADGPLAVGSGREGLVLDKLVARDANDLPYIPGTSLTGVIRHELSRLADTEKQRLNVEDLFGYPHRSKNDKGKGSKICFTSAQLLDICGTKAIEGLANLDPNEAYYSHLQKLPERDHVRITHRGVADAENSGKFEEQLVHKGTRFVFEMECRGNTQDAKAWGSIVNTIHSPIFRIGGGTRKGFGKLKIIKCQTRQFSLYKSEDLKAYLNKSSSLNSTVNWTKTMSNHEVDLPTDWIHYQVRLTPENFFIFGAGHGDMDGNVDMTPKREEYFIWDTNNANPELSEGQILVPATSVKGAISHRLAYNYNKEIRSQEVETTGISTFDIETVLANYQFDENINDANWSPDDPKWEEMKQKIQAFFSWEKFSENAEWKKWKGEIYKNLPDNDNNNPAVKALFGFAKGKDENIESEKDGARGNAIFSDLHQTVYSDQEKILDHVAIDRFTSGALDTALYQEKVIWDDVNEYTLDIYVHEDAFNGEDSKIKTAFEKTLTELKNGRIPLGGNTMKGHGIFTGTWKTVQDQKTEA